MASPSGCFVEIIIEVDCGNDRSEELINWRIKTNLVGARVTVLTPGQRFGNHS